MPIFNDFSGGQSPSIHRGIRGSFPAIVGLDIWSEPGVLKVAQAMAKDSGSTVTELCKNVVVASDGNSYWSMRSADRHPCDTDHRRSRGHRLR